MSDCSAAMKPNERRTCGTCKHVNDVRLGCMFAASDNSYYMLSTKPDARACGHYVDDPDSLPRRHERIAQVAREMHAWCDGIINKAWTIVPERIDGFREKLEALGVSVDDRT